MSLLTKKVWRNYPSFLNTEQESEELYAITESFRQAIEETGIDIETSKKMMYLLTAEGEWIDRWGDYFGVKRLENEEDENYKQRIIWEVIRPRQTIDGLKQVISYYSGIPKSAIEIYEYFRELSPVDFGARADVTRTVGIEQFNWCIINIITPAQLSNEVKRKIEETKAAGIKVYYETFSSLYTIIIDSRPTIIGELRKNKYKEISLPTYIADVFGLTDGNIIKYVVNSNFENKYTSYILDTTLQYNFNNVIFISSSDNVDSTYDHFGNKLIIDLTNYSDIYELSPVKYILHTKGYGNEPYGIEGYGSVIYYSYIHTLYNHQTVFSFESSLHYLPIVSDPQINISELGYGIGQYGIVEYGSIAKEIIYL